MIKFGVFNLISQLISSLVYLGMYFILKNTYQDYSLGVIFTALSYVQFFKFISDLGSTGFIIVNKYIDRYIFIFIFFSAVLISFLFYLFVKDFFIIEVLLTFLLMVSYGVIGIFSSFHFLNNYYLICTLKDVLPNVVFFVLYVLFGDGTLVSVFLVSLISLMPLLVLQYLFSNNVCVITRNSLFGFFCAYRSFFYQNIILCAQKNSFRFFGPALYGYESFGKFVIVYQVLMKITIFYDIFSKLNMRCFKGKVTRKFIRNFDNYFIFLFPVLVSGLCLLFIFSSLVEFYFGKFEVVLYLYFALLLSFVVRPLRTFFICRRQNILNYIDLFSVSLVFPIYYIFVDYGVVGLCFATIFFYSINLILMLFFGFKYSVFKFIIVDSIYSKLFLFLFFYLFMYISFSVFFSRDLVNYFILFVSFLLIIGCLVCSKRVYVES
ncbi:MAG: hypothetical protein VX185_09625 [Pseudomonadota bacterium]|nr:hypothetical protein [Pseudomonadota bacterium]